MGHAVSKVQIGNFALAHVGTRSTIESFTENSTEAPLVALWYDYCRVEALEAFDWSFARRRLVLATIAIGIAEDRWTYRYQYPSDCVAFRKIAGEDTTRSDDAADPFPYAIEMTDDQSAKSILTDVESAVGVYTFDQEITSFFSAHFVNTLSRLLAHRIAPSLTGKQSIIDGQWQEYQSMLRTAPAHNANEQMEPPPRDAEWIRGR